MFVVVVFGFKRSIQRRAVCVYSPFVVSSRGEPFSAVEVSAAPEFLAAAITRLRAADLEATLSFLEDAQTVDGPAPFTPELLDRLIEIVGCEYASFSEVEDPMRVKRGYVGSSAEPQMPEDDGWWESPRTVELRRDRCANGVRPVIVLADVLSRDQRTSADFNFNFRDYGVCDEIHVYLDSSPTWFAALNLGSEREFGPRERLMVQLLHPHLSGLYRSAELRRRLGATTAAFDPDATDRLTRRECEVMLWVADGLSNAEIARVLVVERSTVRKHLEHIYEKLGVRSRTAALARIRAVGPLPTSTLL
jgi:DNA-binding CsgD family transcriptional regulator